MIQRIQTIYLLLAAFAMLGIFFFPLATATGDTTALAAVGDNYFADGVFWANESPAYFGFYILIGAVLAAIFLYKNRPKQMQFAGLAILALLILGVLLAVLGYYYAQRLPEGSSAQIAEGSALPIAAMALLFLAYRNIKKDEELVRSSDRLR